jgi:hypothetical protein
MEATMTRIGIVWFTFGLVAACSGSEHTSSQGQTITCTTDPGTGVILRCAPGDNGGQNSCKDVDEDGDGEPHDTNTVFSSDDPNDDDGDGIPNDEDCDNHPGEDNDRDGELPYDVKPQLGSTATPILDAFAETGGSAPTIVSVTMDGGTWRLTELQNSTPFVVTNDDCNHDGNRDVGRDRVFVTWQTATGTATDHLDIRYCEQ